MRLVGKVGGCRGVSGCCPPPQQDPWRRTTPALVSAYVPRHPAHTLHAKNSELTNCYYKQHCHTQPTPQLTRVFLGQARGWRAAALARSFLDSISRDCHTEKVLRSKIAYTSGSIRGIVTRCMQLLRMRIYAPGPSLTK